MTKLFTWLGGRRLSLCIGCAAICTGLLCFDHIDQYVYRDIILGTVAAYIAGNTAQAIKDAKTPGADNPPLA